jgi:outer membrane receptor protein involved in Fe transport
VLPGLRLECVDTDTDDLVLQTDNSDDFLEVLPALSVNYRVEEDWAVYAAVQKSFRSPAVYNFSTRPGVPQDLDAESAWSYEIGTRGRILDEAIYFDFDLFYLDFDDRIVKDTTRPEGYVNQGHVVHKGAELTVEADLGKLTDQLRGVEVFGALSFVDAEIKSGVNDGNRSANAPPYKVSWGVKYTHPTGVWGMVDGFWVARSYSDNENTRDPSPNGYRGIQPSYTIWNVRAGYETALLDDRLKLGCQAGINNFVDEEYFYRRSGKGILPGVPRRYYGSVSLEVSF